MEKNVVFFNPPLTYMTYILWQLSGAVSFPPSQCCTSMQSIILHDAGSGQKMHLGVLGVITGCTLTVIKNKKMNTYRQYFTKMFC